MIKNIFLSILLFCTIYCNSQNKESSINELQSCLSKKDLSELDSAISLFEKELSKIYPNQKINKAYLKYLNDVNLMKITPSFFFNEDSKKVLKNLKASGTFNKIWTSLSSIESKTNEEGDFDEIPLNTDSQTSNQKLEIITLNPNGGYINCQLDKNINKSVLKLLKMQKDVPGLNFQMTSSLLLENMTEEDFNSELNRLAVSLEFYYTLVYMFQNNEN